MPPSPSPPVPPHTDTHVALHTATISQQFFFSVNLYSVRLTPRPVPGTYRTAGWAHAVPQRALWRAPAAGTHERDAAPAAMAGIDGAAVHWLGLGLGGAGTLLLALGRGAARRARALAGATPASGARIAAALAAGGGGEERAELWLLQGRCESFAPIQPSALVALRGVVTPLGDALPLTRSGSEGVLVERSVEQHFLGHRGDGWAPESRLVHRQLDIRPWAVDDGSGVRAQVVGAEEASCLGSALELVHDAFEPADGTAKGLLRSGLDCLRGLKLLGLRRRESVLKVGTQVTVIGEASLLPDAAGDGAPRLVLRKPRPRGACAGSALFRKQRCGGSAQVCPFVVSKLEVDELVARAGRGALALTSLGALFVGLGAALVAGRALRTMRRRRRGKRAMEAWRRCARAMQVARLLRARFPSSAAIATASTYPRAAVL